MGRSLRDAYTLSCGDDVLGASRCSADNVSFSGGLKRQEGDFRWAVESEGQADGADAAVDVKLDVLQVIEAFGVDLAHGRQNERTGEGQTNLAAVGVTGKDEIDERAAGVFHDGVCVVGLVRHQNDGGVRFGGYGEIEIGVAGSGVFEAADPEAVAVFFDGDVLVDQHRSSVAGECFNDHGGVEGDVVVAEDGVAQRCGESGEDLGAAVHGVFAGDEGE